MVPPAPQRLPPLVLTRFGGSANAPSAMMQGAAAYGFDPFFSPRQPLQPRDSCLPASSATGQMTCVFWSARPFSLRFCSDAPRMPW